MRARVFTPREYDLDLMLGAFPQVVENRGRLRPSVPFTQSARIRRGRTAYITSRQCSVFQVNRRAARRHAVPVPVERTQQSSFIGYRLRLPLAPSLRRSQRRPKVRSW
jgi:hypothetical protein